MVAAIKRPEIREAIFIASPDLDAALDAWETGAIPHSKRSRIEQSLLRYLSRMAYRPTPFGIFSGYSIGKIGSTTDLKIDSLLNSIRRTRLDHGYLTNLSKKLEEDHQNREYLVYYPNTTLTFTKDRLHYIEDRQLSNDITGYNLVAIERDDQLSTILNMATPGATISSLTRHLVDDCITEEEARAYIHELIDNQVLVSGIGPLLTGDSTSLINHGFDLGGSTLGLAERRLVEVNSELQRLDSQGLGASPTRYKEIAKKLAVLPSNIDIKYLFQTDLLKSASSPVLSSDLVNQFVEAAFLLNRIQSHQSNPTLQNFISRFQNRYDRQWVPLAVAIDPEVGVGYDEYVEDPVSISAILNGLPPQHQAKTGPIFSARDSYIINHLMNNKSDTEWVLTELDITNLENPNPSKFPDSFSILGMLSRSGDENSIPAESVQLRIKGFHGPSGARLLGRFCNLDPTLQSYVREHIRTEEEHNPEAIYAEIVHLPAGRMGNFLSRPVLRQYEIPYLGKSGARSSQQIPISDLEVSVVDGKVVLRSIRMNRRVLPRLTTAHNYSSGIALYRLLCAVQDQDGLVGGWAWGAAECLDFLPRVRFKNCILQRARWVVSKSEIMPILQEAGTAQFKLFKEWQKKRRIPQLIVLADGDNELLIDLNQMLWIETFFKIVSQREVFQLIECWPHPENLVATGPEGSFTHEIVLPLAVSARTTESRTHQKQLNLNSLKPANSKEHRSFPPGTEWLYISIFSNPANSDQILLRDIVPIISELSQLHAIKSWFFIRYTKPSHHLRIRIQSTDTGIEASVKPLVLRMFNNLQSNGLAWKYSIDTYEREIERYGGEEGIVLAEQIFQIDSKSCLNLIKISINSPESDTRWTLGLKSINTMFDVWGFTLQTKLEIALSILQNMGRELSSRDALDIRLGEIYRNKKEFLNRLIFEDYSNDAIIATGIEILKARNQEMSSIVERYLHLDQANALSQPIESISTSINHMTLNRLCRSNQRIIEYIIYSYLSKIYTSEIKKQTKTSKVHSVD